MNPRIISLTTDFGDGSPYVAQMKGVILSLNPTAKLVDITHSIPPQDVRSGALALLDSSRWFPPGAIHVAVVDPGVGTERKILAIGAADHQYVGPDNGLLSWAAARSQKQLVVQVRESRYWLPQVSSTFHGRDIMAPVAAHLSLGLGLSELGPALASFEQLPWPQVVTQEGHIEGVILSVDSFGNLISNIQPENLAGLDRKDCQVWVGDRLIRGISQNYGGQAPGELVALFGSQNRLEVAVINGSAGSILHVAPESQIVVKIGGLS